MPELSYYYRACRRDDIICQPSRREHAPRECAQSSSDAQPRAFPATLMLKYGAWHTRMTTAPPPRDARGFDISSPHFCHHRARRPATAALYARPVSRPRFRAPITPPRRASRHAAHISYRLFTRRYRSRLYSSPRHAEAQRRQAHNGRSHFA